MTIISRNSLQKGNILFIILIAVGLFAALSYAVSNRSIESETFSEEKASIYAADILSYAREIEGAIARMQSKGISETDLCFDIDEYPGGDTRYEHTACADEKNRVFHPAGGGIKYRLPSSKYFDSSFSAGFHYSDVLFTGHTFIEDLPIGSNSGGIPTQQAELILITAGLKKSLCDAINKALGHDYDPDSDGLEPSAPFQANSNDYYTGTFSTAIRIGDIPANGFVFNQKPNGCFQSSLSHNGNVAYFVLIPR